MSHEIPPTALALIKEAEQAARDGTLKDTQRQKIKAAGAAILEEKRKAQRCFAELAELQKHSDALAEETLALAQAMLDCNKKIQSLLVEKQRLEAEQAEEEQQYGYEAAFLLCLQSSQHLGYGRKELPFKWKLWDKLTDDHKWKKANLLALIHKLPFRPHSSDIERLWNEGLVPADLEGDKDLLLGRLLRDDFHRPYYRFGEDPPIFSIPQPLTTDKEVVCAVVFRYPEILKQNAISEMLLDDDDVFSAFVRSPRWKNYCGYAAGCDEKTPFGLLSMFSARIHDSSNMMLEAVKMTNGLCLQGASSDLRGSEEFVRAACDQCAYAFFYCDPPTKSKLLADKDFMLHVMSNVSDYSLFKDGIVLRKEDKHLYKKLPLGLQLDPEMICASKKSGFLSTPADLRDSLAEDPTFWQEMIRKESSFFSILPRKFENDEAFARAITNFKHSTTVKHVFERFPALSDDEDIWRTIIASNGEDGGFMFPLPSWLDFVIEEYAPPRIRQNVELMLRALTRNIDVFELLPLDLQDDHRFAETLLEDPSGLAVMPADVQRLNHDLVATSLQRTDDIEHLVGHITPELWSDPDHEVLKSFFRRAPAASDLERLPVGIKNDETCGLLAAELLDYEEEVSGVNFFESAVSATLRSNSGFMTKAVRLDAIFFLSAVGPLRRDQTLAMLAVSDEEKGQQIVKRLAADFDDAGTAAFLRQLWRETKEEINTYEKYFTGILCGLSPFAGDGCSLTALLSKDQETTTALKQHIAALMGVPLGAELDTLRRAVKNLDSVLALEALWDE